MSLRKAINEKCKDCIYDPCAPGNWRQQVQACTIKTCSLWPVRPLSTPSGRSVQKSPELAPETDLAAESGAEA